MLWIHYLICMCFVVCVWNLQIHSSICRTLDSSVLEPALIIYIRSHRSNKYETIFGVWNFLKPGLLVDLPRKSPEGSPAIMVILFMFFFRWVEQRMLLLLVPCKMVQRCSGTELQGRSIGWTDTKCLRGREQWRPLAAMCRETDLIKHC